MRPRPRPRPVTVRLRPRPRPKKWSRDHAGLETLTSLVNSIFYTVVIIIFLALLQYSI